MKKNFDAMNGSSEELEKNGDPAKEADGLKESYKDFLTAYDDILKQNYLKTHQIF